MLDFFPDRGGFTHKDSYGYDPEKCAFCGERFPHSIALILLVDLTHGNFLIGQRCSFSSISTHLHTWYII